MIRRVLFALHRVLGTLLSLLFLVWFLSGFVMLFHTFPRVTIQDKYLHLDPIQGELPAIDSLELSSSLSRLKLTLYGERVIFDAGTISQPTYSEVEAYARKWCNAPILKVDTLTELEQWIPFSRLQKEMPIYKYYFSDVDKHQLYLSSKTGEALQFTNKESRFWAWLGPIPHWLYFTSLRQNAQQWVDVVVWLSALGAIMCITGAVLGIRSFLKYYYRRKRVRTPYKKPLYKWHHLVGFFFGFFAFTFVFSGMMSLVEIPQWIAKVHNPNLATALQKREVVLANYKADYRTILQQYKGQVKQIEWASWGDIPLYKAVINNEMLLFDASSVEARLLVIDEPLVIAQLSKIHSEPFSVSLLTEYDNYYVDRKKRMPLPVYKVDVSDSDNSTYYIAPKTAATTYFNTNSKIRRYSYQALHSFKLGFLVKKPVLWSAIMWITMLGGTILSFTGVWLGIRYIKRKLREIKKNISKI